MIFAKTLDAIPARSGLTLGSGKVATYRQVGNVLEPQDSHKLALNASDQPIDAGSLVGLDDAPRHFDGATGLHGHVVLMVSGESEAASDETAVADPEPVEPAKAPGSSKVAIVPGVPIVAPIKSA
jgi:hypothetical protein